MTTQTLRYIKIYNLNWVSSPELSQNTFIEFKIPKNFADADIEPKIFFYLELVFWRQISLKSIMNMKKWQLGNISLENTSF